MPGEAEHKKQRIRWIRVKRKGNNTSDVVRQNWTVSTVPNHLPCKQPLTAALKVSLCAVWLSTVFLAKVFQWQKKPCWPWAMRACFLYVWGWIFQIEKAVENSLSLRLLTFIPIVLTVLIFVLCWYWSTSPPVRFGFIFKECRCHCVWEWHKGWSDCGWLSFDPRQHEETWHDRYWQSVVKDIGSCRSWTSKILPFQNEVDKLILLEVV